MPLEKHLCYQQFHKKVTSLMTRLRVALVFYYVLSYIVILRSDGLKMFEGAFTGTKGVMQTQHWGAPKIQTGAQEGHNAPTRDILEKVWHWLPVQSWVLSELWQAWLILWVERFAYTTLLFRTHMPTWPGTNVLYSARVNPLWFPSWLWMFFWYSSTGKMERQQT